MLFWKGIFITFQPTLKEPDLYRLSKISCNCICSSLQCNAPKQNVWKCNLKHGSITKVVHQLFLISCLCTIKARWLLASRPSIPFSIDIQSKGLRHQIHLGILYSFQNCQRIHSIRYSLQSKVYSWQWPCSLSINFRPIISWILILPSPKCPEAHASISDTLESTWVKDFSGMWQVARNRSHEVPG